MQKFHSLGAVDHDMEVSASPSPPNFIPWSPPSSMTTPESRVSDSGNGSRPTPYPNRFIQPANSRVFDFNMLSTSSGFLDMSGITMNEASFSRAGHGQSPHPRLLSPFGHGAEAAHLPVGPVLLPHSHEQQQPLPRSGRYPSSRTRGYSMPYNYGAPSSAEGLDDEQSPGAMHNSRTEGYGQVFGGNKGFKSRRNLAKGKEATFKGSRATAARSRTLATSASTSRSGSISQQIAPSDRFSIQNPLAQTPSTALMVQGYRFSVFLFF